MIKPRNEIDYTPSLAIYFDGYCKCKELNISVLFRAAIDEWLRESTETVFIGTGYDPITASMDEFKAYSLHYG